MDSKQIFQSLKLIQSLNIEFEKRNIKASGKDVEHYFRHLYKTQKELEIESMKFVESRESFQMELKEALKEIDGGDGI